MTTTTAANETHRAGEVSSTAKVIALATVACWRAQRHTDLLDEDMSQLSEVFLKASAPAWLGWAAGRRVTSKLLLGLERITVPGIVPHYFLRKRWIERAAVAAIERGCKQVIVVGAGFDTLAVRLAASHPDVAFFEIDRHTTQMLKVQALAESGHASRVNFLPADLAEHSLAEVLRSGPGFSETSPSFVVAEGLLMYLEEPDVVRFFSELSACLAGGSEVAFTFMNPLPDGTLGYTASSRFVSPWLQRQGERRRWGIAPAHLEAFLSSAGFALSAVEETHQLDPDPRRRGAVARGEWLALAAARGS